MSFFLTRIDGNCAVSDDYEIIFFGNFFKKNSFQNYLNQEMFRFPDEPVHFKIRRHHRDVYNYFACSLSITFLFALGYLRSINRRVVVWHGALRIYIYIKIH